MQFTIDSNTYNLKQYTKLTLGEFMTLLGNEPKMPESLKEIYKGELSLKSISDEEYNTVYLPYFIDYIAFATDAPKVELYNCKKEDIERLFSVCIESFNIDENVYYNPDVRSITHKGTTYYLPDRFMRQSKVIDFIDAAQFERIKEMQTGNNLNALRELLLLLLRKDWDKRTPITPKYIQVNIRKFDDLPMTDVLQVYFFLQRQNDIYETLSRIATDNQQQNKYAQESHN